MNTIIFEFTPNIKFIGGIRKCIDNIMTNLGFEDWEKYDIKLIMDELCSNAIEHGRKDVDSKIKVKCRIDRELIEMKVINSGCKRFDIKKVIKNAKRFVIKNRMNKKIEMKGYGLYLVNKLADKLHVNFKDESTEINIVKFPQSGFAE